MIQALRRHLSSQARVSMSQTRCPTAGTQSLFYLFNIGTYFVSHVGSSTRAWGCLQITHSSEGNLMRAGVRHPASIPCTYRDREVCTAEVATSCRSSCAVLRGIPHNVSKYIQSPRMRAQSAPRHRGVGGVGKTSDVALRTSTAGTITGYAEGGGGGHAVKVCSRSLCVL